MTDQKKYTHKLEDKRVLVIGGSAGIGYGVAEASLEYGAKVIISSSNPQRIQASITRLQEAYPSRAGNVQGVTCNLSSEDIEDNFVRLFEQIGELLCAEAYALTLRGLIRHFCCSHALLLYLVAIFSSTICSSLNSVHEVLTTIIVGNIDHVVFTAGDSLAMMPLADVNLAKAKTAGQIRFFAPLLLAKHLPRTTLSYTLTTGRIAAHPIKDWTVIASYASGLHAMTRNLAVDIAPVRVNLISPGQVDTELWRQLTGIDQKSAADQAQAVEDAGERSLTGRVGKVEDVVEGYLAFMKDANVTGTIYSSDGGYVLL
jgi:NAD(P)-dependent dehydrogenase (short-subunit alcohol dehydrogenase family)